MAVTGSACTAEDVRELAAGRDVVVVVWSDDAELSGRLVAEATAAGARAASFVAGGGPAAEAALRLFAAEQFGCLDGVVGRQRAG